MKGLISGIKRMEIHDGDGLRTTVFFKGCPLKCIWCHNPESIDFSKQLAYFQEKCIGCESCVSACKEKSPFALNPPFPDCSFCLDCVNACPTNALIAYGKEYTLDELLSAVLQDEPFFKNGNGGVTLSGGECLAQPKFAVAFAKRLSEKGISVYVDTCGYVKQDVFTEILPFIDTFLYDVKAFDNDLHTRLTGKGNRLILENLSYLSRQNARIEIRYPLIQGVNSDETEKIAAYLSTLCGITKVKVLQYHAFAASRYQALGMKNTLPDVKTTFDDVERAVQVFKKHGLPAVNGINE